MSSIVGVTMSSSEEMIAMSLADEGENKSNSKLEKIRNHLKFSTRDYLRRTSVFWFRRVGDENRPVIEKFFWISFFLISLGFCVVLIHKNAPSRGEIVITFANKQLPVSEVPFPSITICPQTKSKQSVYNFTEYYHRNLEGGLTGDELDKFSEVSILCDNHLVRSGPDYTIFNTTFLASVAPSISDTFRFCKWKASNTVCSDIFTPIVTDQGICFNFNLLNSDDIFKTETYKRKSEEKSTLKNGQNFRQFHEGIPRRNDSSFEKRSWFLDSGGYGDGFKGSSVSESPRRVATSGRVQSLFLLLESQETDADYMCKGPTQGFAVQLHRPDELPLMVSHFDPVPLDRETILAVEPKIAKTSEKLRARTPAERGCHFSDEKPLKYFTEYNQRHCELECASNFTLKTCGCVNFHQPRDGNVKICGTNKSACVFKARSSLMDLEAQENPECDCLPSCNSLKYSAEISNDQFKYKQVLEAFKIPPSLFKEGMQMTRLVVYFKDSHFVPLERKEISSGGDFLVYFCAILSFFTGFSALTLVELLYFYFRFLFDCSSGR